MLFLQGAHCRFRRFYFFTVVVDTGQGAVVVGVTWRGRGPDIFRRLICLLVPWQSGSLVTCSAEARVRSSRGRCGAVPRSASIGPCNQNPKPISMVHVLLLHKLCTVPWLARRQGWAGLVASPSDARSCCASCPPKAGEKRQAKTQVIDGTNDCCCLLPWLPTASHRIHRAHITQDVGWISYSYYHRTSSTSPTSIQPSVT